MIPTNRPLPWFGPDDYEEGDIVAFEISKRNLEIARWDAHRAKLMAEMHWSHRLFHMLFTSSDRLP